MSDIGHGIFSSLPTQKNCSSIANYVLLGCMPYLFEPKGECEGEFYVGREGKIPWPVKEKCYGHHQP